MKKLIFAGAVTFTAILFSCNGNNSDTSTTMSDSATTDNTTSTTGTGASSMNSGSDTGNQMNSTNSAGANTSGTGTGTGTSGTTGNMQPDAATTQFVSKAASGGMMEIELGNIAKNKASSQRVKDYANMIVTDHTAAANELRSTASSNGVTVPGDMMAEHRQHIDMMKNKSGAEFDKAYINMMVTDHKKDIAEYKKASSGLKTDAVKSYATRTLPVLQKHLDSAQAISKKM